jgi:hypothetical protein
MTQHADPFAATTAAPHALDKSALMRRWRAGANGPRRWPAFRWALQLTAFALDAVVVGLGISLVLLSVSKASQPTDRAVWDPLRDWVTQEGGHNQPFDTIYRDTVEWAWVAGWPASLFLAASLAAGRWRFAAVGCYVVGLVALAASLSWLAAGSWYGGGSAWTVWGGLLNLALLAHASLRHGYRGRTLPSAAPSEPEA